MEYKDRRQSREHFSDKSDHNEIRKRNSEQSTFEKYLRHVTLQRDWISDSAPNLEDFTEEIQLRFTSQDAISSCSSKFPDAYVRHIHTEQHSFPIRAGS